MHPDYAAKELAQVAIGSRMTTLETLEVQISNYEKKLADLKELKSLLESEPKLSRALELMGRGIY